MYLSKLIYLRNALQLPRSSQYQFKEFALSSFDNGPNIIKGIDNI